MHAPSVLEEGTIQRRVYLGQLSLGPRERRHFVRAARARLQGRQSHDEAALLRHWMDAVRPVLQDVLTAALGQRNGFRPQLERVRLDRNLCAEPARGFLENGDLEVAIGSNVV